MKEKTLEKVIHEFEPVYDQYSRVLILGTFPSVKSREGQFYYHHPQNRFWRVLSAIAEEPLPMTIEEKKKMLLKHHIAIWDVIADCEIYGSSDSSIRNVTANDINRILMQANIEKILANGDKAYRLYEKYCLPDTEREIKRLPSTSPANAACSLEKLIKIWKEEINGTLKPMQTLYIPE